MTTAQGTASVQPHPPAGRPTRGDRLNAAAIGLGLVAGMGGYWTWLATSGLRTSDDDSWVDFEKTFPLADAYLAVVAAAAARHMWRGTPPAVGLGIAAGSASTFLGLMDVLYNLEHGKYADRSADAALEAAVNVASLTLGPITMMRMWRARHRLLA